MLNGVCSVLLGRGPNDFLARDPEIMVTPLMNFPSTEMYRKVGYQTYNVYRVLFCFIVLCIILFCLIQCLDRLRLCWARRYDL